MEIGTRAEQIVSDKLAAPQYCGCHSSFLFSRLHHISGDGVDRAAECRTALPSVCRQEGQSGPVPPLRRLQLGSSTTCVSQESDEPFLLFISHYSFICC
jgi:hypothetical protein